MEAAWARVVCTPYARQTRAAPTLALVKALLIAHDEDPDSVFWPYPGGRVGRTKPGKMSRQSRPREPQPWGWRPPPPPRGDSASSAGVPEGAAEGATLVQQPGQLATALAEEWRERTFSVGRLVNLLPLVFVLEHGPQQGGRGSRQKVSRAWQEEHLPEAFTLVLRLLITHIDGVDTKEGYTKLHTFGMCNGMPFSDFSGVSRTYADRCAE